jgi:Trk-type K+ transport system membrane component
MRYAFSEVRKTVIGLVGFAVAVLAAFLTIAASSIPNEWLPWVQVIVAVATSVGDVGPGDVPPDVATHYDPGP